MCRTRPKSLNRIVLKENDGCKILELIDTWMKSEDRYKELGMSHKLGLLLYGTPGSGKTSLAYSIAMHLNFDIIQCTLSSIVEHGTTSPRCVYVLDDVDRELGAGDEDRVAKAMDEMKKNGGIEVKSKGNDVKGLLSVLDARVSANNVIIVMTCNNLSALDPAIYRPGRVDMALEFGVPDRGMAEKFMGGFYGTAVELPDFVEGRSMSFYQVCCLKHMNSARLAAEEAMDPNSNIGLAPSSKAEMHVEREMARG